MTNRRGNHEGSIRKLPSGSFRVQVTINGKKDQLFRPNAQGSSGLASADQSGMYGNCQVSMKDLTLEEYLDNWLPVKKTTIRHATHVQYSQIIRDYVIPLLEMSVSGNYAPNRFKVCTATS